MVTYNSSRYIIQCTHGSVVLSYHGDGLVWLVWFLLFQFVASTVQSTNIKRDKRKEKIKQSREEDTTERKEKRRETEKECGGGDVCSTNRHRYWECL